MSIKNDFMGLDGLSIQLPVEANMQLPDPQLVNYYNDYKNRAIWIDKDIDDSLFEEIRMIYNWNREDAEAGLKPEERKPITIYVHSCGGNLDAAFAIVDAMNLSKTPIRTVNINNALSAGALIFINGHKGLRYCMPMSSALLHSGSGGSGGSFEAVVAQTENYKMLVGMMRDNIIQHTTIPKATFTKNSKKEWYIYAEDQIKYGLADHIVTDLSEVL